MPRIWRFWLLFVRAEAPDCRLKYICLCVTWEQMIQERKGKARVATRLGLCDCEWQNGVEVLRGEVAELSVSVCGLMSFSAPRH